MVGGGGPVHKTLFSREYSISVLTIIHAKAGGNPGLFHVERSS